MSDTFSRPTTVNPVAETMTVEIDTGPLTRDTRVSLAPLDPQEALRAMLRTPRPESK